MELSAARSHTLDLVLINEFDSVEQTKLIVGMARRGQSPSEIENYFVGLLRMGLILCQEVVVTDAMLLDGRFFQMVSPRELELRLGLTGRPLGIRVLSAHSSLRATLEAKLADKNFFWQLASIESESSFPSPAIQARWQEWIEAEERGSITIRPYADRPDGSFSRTLTSLLNETSRHAHLNSTVEPDVLEKSKSLHDRRSEAFVYFDALRDADHEVTQLRDWWNQSYLEAIAREQGAAWMTFQPSADLSGAKTFRIWDSLLERVSNSSPAVFSTLFYALRSEREKWHGALTAGNSRGRHRRGNRALAGIAYITENHLSAPRRSMVAIRATLTILVGGIAFVLSQTATGKRPELSWLVVVVAIAALPWHEARTLYGAVKSAKTGVLKIV
jgi:hypothetical protein